jgi:hypothetical protein
VYVLETRLDLPVYVTCMLDKGSRCLSATLFGQREEVCFVVHVQRSYRFVLDVRQRANDGCVGHLVLSVLLKAALWNRYLSYVAEAEQLFATLDVSNTGKTS